MSQLDISISFSHLFGLLFCFYLFIHYISINLIQYWYNNKLRSLSHEDLSLELKELDNTVIIKRILKL